MRLNSDAAVETLTDAGTFFYNMHNISFHEFPHLGGNINHVAHMENVKRRQADGRQV